MVRIFMVSDLPLFSQGVEMLLRKEKGVDIVGRESDIEAALEKLKRLCPDVVILDSSCLADKLPAIAARILTVQQNTRVIAMSLESNTVTVFREEQRIIHEIQDLMHAITNGTFHPELPGAKF